MRRDLPAIAQGVSLQHHLSPEHVHAKIGQVAPADVSIGDLRDHLRLKGGIGGDALEQLLTRYLDCAPDLRVEREGPY